MAMTRSSTKRARDRDTATEAQREAKHLKIADAEEESAASVLTTLQHDHDTSGSDDVSSFWDQLVWKDGLWTVTEQASERAKQKAAEANFIEGKLKMWKKATEERLGSISDFRLAHEGPGAVAHERLAEAMGAVGATESEYLAAREDLELDIQDWQKDQFVDACGGRGARARLAENLGAPSGPGKEGAPAAASADTEGIGPLGGLFGTTNDGNRSKSSDSAHLSSAAGGTDGETSNPSPEKASQSSDSPSPSTSPSTSPSPSNVRAGKRRREEEGDEDDGSQGHAVKRARQ